MANKSEKISITKETPEKISISKDGEKKLEVKTTPEKITFSKEGVKTTITPTTEEGKLVTKVVSQVVSEEGIPSNEDLDEFGDKIWELLEISRKNAPDYSTGKLAENTQKIVSDIQQVVREKNYDERLQEITKKLKATPKDISGIANELRVDAERIRDCVREISPNLFKLARSLIGDYKFRELLVTLLDVLQNSYERVQEFTPNISETFKADLKDTKQSEPKRTEEAIEWKVENFRRYATLTDEEKDRILDKFSETLIKLRKNRNYYDFVEGCFRFYDELSEVWCRIKDNSELNSIYFESASIMYDIKVLFERSANRSLDRWIELVRDLGRAKDDPRFVETRKDLEELFFDRDGRYQSKEEIKEMYYKIKKNLEDLNNSFDNVFDELSYESRRLLNGISTDPSITKIRNDITALFKEIFTDISGKPSVNLALDAAMKIKNVFFPVIKNKLEHVSLPIIEVESPQYFFKIEDFNLFLPQLIPEQIQIETDSSVKIDTDKMSRKGSLNFKITLYPINTKIEKLKFLLNKKTGIKYYDYGIVDIKLKDCGIVFYFTIKLEEYKVDFIELTKVDSNFDGMKIKIIDSRHDILDKIITGIFRPTLRAKVKESVDESLMDTINSSFFEQINNALRSIEDKSL